MAQLDRRCHGNEFPWLERMRGVAPTPLLPWLSNADVLAGQVEIAQHLPGLPAFCKRRFIRHRIRQSCPDIPQELFCCRRYCVVVHNVLSYILKLLDLEGAGHRLNMYICDKHRSRAHLAHGLAAAQPSDVIACGPPASLLLSMRTTSAGQHSSPPAHQGSLTTCARRRKQLRVIAHSRFTTVKVFTRRRSA